MAYNKIVYGGRVLIDLTSDTVEADKILTGYTTHDKTGEVITGTCTFNADTSDADASASEILATKTAYVNGNKLTGTMTNNGGISSDISSKDQVVTIPAGFHDGSGSVQISSLEKDKIIASNIKDGVQLLGVTGTYTGEGATAQAKTVTPYTTQQVVLPDSNYDYLSQVTVEAIAYSETPNAFGTTVTIGTVAPI